MNDSTRENHRPSAASRRQFLQAAGRATAALGAALLAGGSSPAWGEAGATNTALSNRVPKAMLGRTGVEVSRLGIGASPFRRPSLTADDAGAILHRALELGVTYVDAAPEYADKANNSYSEVKIGLGLRGIRDKFFIATKTEEMSYEGTWRLLRQSLKDYQTDYLDLVHLHNFGQEKRFPDLGLTFGDKGALGALREAKKLGVVRFIGASGHLWPSRFHAALDTDEIDVLMNAVNFVVQHTYDFENKVWARARAKDVGLVAMKVLGGAPNSREQYVVPEAYYERAIRYAVSIPGMACAVIGMKSIGELEQLAGTIARVQPLSTMEAHQLAKEGLELAALPEWGSPYGVPLT